MKRRDLERLWYWIRTKLASETVEWLKKNRSVVWESFDHFGVPWNSYSDWEIHWSDPSKLHLAWRIRDILDAKANRVKPSPHVCGLLYKNELIEVLGLLGVGKSEEFENWRVTQLERLIHFHLSKVGALGLTYLL